MNREELIQKWLDHDLNPQELEAFRKLEDYEELSKLDRNLKAFKAPDYGNSDSLKHVLDHTVSRSQRRQWQSAILKIAAVLVLCFSIYTYFNIQDTTIQSLVAQKESFGLPDDSYVELNALSTLTFNENDWDDNREVNLEGEAYFKVAKGSTFEVITENGSVKVLGTEFNVKARKDMFEVTCYEGKVGVKYESNDAILLPGEAFLIFDGKFIATEKENDPVPSWLKNQSKFRSIPYKAVIAEFERQHNVSIELQNIDDSQLFTGSFTHNDIEIALKSITLPLHLTYSKTDNIITLKSE